MKFFKIVPGVLLLSSFAVATALAQPNEMPTTIANPPVPAPRVPRPGTPKEQIEFDLKLLFDNLNSLSTNGGDDFLIPTAISDARIGYFGLSEWKDYFVQRRGKTQYRLDKIEFETVEKDTARVKVSYALLTPNNVRPADGRPAETTILTANEVETLDLKREIVPWQNPNEKWRIVPPTVENLQPYRTLSLQHIAYYASQRAGTLPQLRAEISASRLKQAALGVLQFVQDYDERFRFQNEFWREAIRPYVQNDNLYYIPGTKTPYSFNDNLSDKSMADINEAAQTVLFYEGSDEKPTFRYNGKAAICFTDGHVQLVTPDGAAKLIWKP